MNLLLRCTGWLVLALSGGSVGIPAQEPLTLRQAIEMAVKSNPESDAARAKTQEAKAGAALVRTQLLPQLQFTEDISRGNDPVYVFGTKLRQQHFTQTDFALNSLNRPTPVGNFASRLSGSWMLFDTFRTQQQIRSADLGHKSAEASARAVDQNVVLHVLQAYQGVLYAERAADVAQHELETAEALLGSVDDRVKSGLTVESDRMSAQVNTAAMKQELIAAQGNVDLAWAQLRVAMGTPDLPQSKLSPMEARELPQSALEQDLQTAAKTRPDLLAAELGQSAQASSTRAARLSFGPRVSAYGNWEDDRSSLGNSGGNNWVAGVQVGVDILPFSKRAELQRAQAAQVRTAAELSSYRQAVQFQVTQAHIQRRTAQLTLDTARAAIQQSTESLRILRNRYGAGLATLTDMLRAEDAERQAQTNYWRAVYDNTVAYAQLLYATGSLTPEAAEDLQ